MIERLNNISNSYAIELNKMLIDFDVLCDYFFP